MIEIKKYVPSGRGIMEDRVVVTSQNPSVIMRYAKNHRALIGQYGNKLIAQFGDRATCEYDFASEALLSDWLYKQVQHRKDYVFVASRVANYKVVVFDETEYWSPDMVEKAGGKIYATYLFDSASATYCCELTPSYYLIHLFSTPLQDTEDGTVEQEIREAESGCDNDAYYHCHSIDSQLAQCLVHDFGLVLADETSDIGVSLSDIEEGYREWCQGNCDGLQLPPRQSLYH